MEIEFEPSRELFPFESRWFESGVGRVHYIDEGEGRPILFCHGNPTWSFLYRNIIRELRDDFRCVAVDYPGFGLSVRPDDGEYGYTPREHAAVVSDLMGRLDLDDFIVMGQDWGGPIGLRVAVEFADRVGGIVAGNTWFWPTDKRLNRFFSWFMSTQLMNWANIEKNFFVERMIPMGTAKKLTEEEMDHYRAVQPGPRARYGAAEFPKQLTKAGPWLAELEADVRSNLSHLPLLLTWGMRDVAFSPGYFIPRWKAVFQDHTLVELDEAKHFIQEDAPNRIARAIASEFGIRNEEGDF